MIRSEDGSIVLSKTLAWTIVTAVVLGGMYLGSQMRNLNELKKDVHDLDRKFDQFISLPVKVRENSAAIQLLISRQREAEMEQARTEEKLNAILTSLGRIEARLDRQDGRIEEVEESPR